MLQYLDHACINDFIKQPSAENIANGYGKSYIRFPKRELPPLRNRNLGNTELWGGIGGFKLLKDIQSEIDVRGVALNRVGIKNIDWPLKVYDKENKFQRTVAKISLSVDLKHDVKGTHMSRFIEVLNDIEIVKPSVISSILEIIKARLDARSSFFECTFPYFISKKSPVSHSVSPLKIEAAIMAQKKDDEDKMFIGVNVPAQTLCPCSKAISQFGAHNQRANIKILAETQSGYGLNTL